MNLRPLATLSRFRRWHHAIFTSPRRYNHAAHASEGKMPFAANATAKCPVPSQRQMAVHSPVPQSPRHPCQSIAMRPQQPSSYHFCSLAVCPLASDIAIAIIVSPPLLGRLARTRRRPYFSFLPRSAATAGAMNSASIRSRWGSENSPFSVKTLPTEKVVLATWLPRGHSAMMVYWSS